MGLLDLIMPKKKEKEYTCRKCLRKTPKDKFYPKIRKCRSCYEVDRRKRKKPKEQSPSTKKRAELECAEFYARKTLMNKINYHMVHGNMGIALEGAKELCRELRKIIRIKEGSS